MRELVQFVPNSIFRRMATLVANNAQRAVILILGQEVEVLLVRHVLRLVTVPTRPRSHVPMAPIKSRPLVTPVTGWSEVRVLRVMLLHLPFKATAQCAKPVRQVRTPTPVLAPPVPLVHPVERVASVIMLPLRVPMAPIKSWPRVMLVMAWSLINAKSVTRVNMQFKATVLPALIVLRYMYPMARVRLVLLRLPVGARP